MKKKHGKCAPVPDPAYLEHAIEIFAQYGDDELLIFIKEGTKHLKNDRNRFERSFPELPTGNNLAILQLEAVLDKVGLR